jgi:hypothetical protein
MPLLGDLPDVSIPVDLKPAFTLSLESHVLPCNSHINCPPRYLTPFRAEWDPKDLTERLIIIGRYISEDWGGVALHPVDVLDAHTGVLLQQLTDINLTTICPVNKPHPRRDLIISGSSR